MLRARKRLLPPRAGGEPSLPDALKDAPSTPERSPPKLQACLLRPTASRCPHADARSFYSSLTLFKSHHFPPPGAHSATNITIPSRPLTNACRARATSAPLCARSEAAIGTTCDARCLYTDALHTGLCVTVDGLAPPSIKRRHLLFKLESAMCIYAQRDMGGVDTHLDDEGDETKRQSSHGSEN